MTESLLPISIERKSVSLTRGVRHCPIMRQPKLIPRGQVNLFCSFGSDRRFDCLTVGHIMSGSVEYVLSYGTGLRIEFLRVKLRLVRVRSVVLFFTGSFETGPCARNSDLESLELGLTVRVDDTLRTPMQISMTIIRRSYRCSESDARREFLLGFRKRSSIESTYSAGDDLTAAALSIIRR